jgi:hypothetical protein
MRRSTVLSLPLKLVFPGYIKPFGEEIQNENETDESVFVRGGGGRERQRETERE